MANKISIESVQIKNFRSIRNETMYLKDFNVFVGLNDAGKSNVLKALNLFFNDETDYNRPFSFFRDFTYLFPPNSHSAKEIKITVKFIIPETYKETGTYTWEKVWRQAGFHHEEITNSNGEEPTARSRVPGTLKRIRYRYVPAVKSADYYKTLLVDLYNTVSSSLNSPLQTSSQVFSDVLRDYTNNLSDNVSERLKIRSELSIPSDLSDVFRALIFITKSNEEGISIPLNARGDGIQARHIPIILKYIAEEDQKSRNQGSMKITTIWGFEEPENGLEMSRAFEMAEEFSHYSKEIQILTTTHSPAFYMNKKNNNKVIYYVHKKNKTEETIFTNEKNSKSINQDMGLMPLIASFVAEQEERYRKIQSIMSASLLDIHTIVVEGKTDKEYIELAIKYLSYGLNKMLDNGTLRVLTKDECGTTQLHDWAIAWSYSGYKSRLFILFDRDPAGRQVKSELENNDDFKEKNKSFINIQLIQPSEEIIYILNKIQNINFFYRIEHLLSIELWKHLKTKHYVDERSDKEMQEMFLGLLPKTRTLNDFIDDLIDNQDIKNTILSLNVKDDKKTKVVGLVREILNTEDGKVFFAGFKRTIQKLEQAFLRE